jgi:2',3'-cyclic-nucleotide 2'-phosphodiesterase/3'-nucleotidase
MILHRLDRLRGLPAACAVAVTAAVVAVGLPAQTAAAAEADTTRLTVLGTTDLHANVFNWDYFNDGPYASNQTGLAKVSTLVKQIRAERGASSTLLLDNGDTFQGTPLGHYFAMVDPITSGTVHPMASVMNSLDYDAMVVGNHEFNYGVPFLRAFESQLEFPLLGANALTWGTDEPAFTPYVIKSVDSPAGPVKVGILGITTPGSAIWDRSHVEGRIAFTGGVEQAAKYVPLMRAEGAEIVVVLSHSGAGSGSSYGDAIPFPENFSTAMAEQVPGIDVILGGHSHSNIAQRLITNAQTGKQVLLTQPGSWGRRLAVVDLDLEKVGGTWTVAGKSSEILTTTGVAEDPAVAALAGAAHQRVVDYVNSPIGTSTTAMPLAQADYRDVAALDLVNYAQTLATRKGLAGTEHADLPVLSAAAPFSLSGGIPQGLVSVRDAASVYIYDNTLIAVKLTGAQVKDYLEWSAQYLRQVSGPGPFTPSQVKGNGPSYNYDVLYGVTYDIDISQPVGSRIENLRFQGAPINPAQEFAVAMNNYRQNGGGAAPHVTTAPIVYNPLVESRQVIIDLVTELGEIDPAMFHTVDWRLLNGDLPVFDAERFADLADLVERFGTDDFVSASTYAGLADRLAKAQRDADLGRETYAIGYLEHFVARARNQIKGDARDLAVRDMLVRSAQALVTQLRALDEAEQAAA